MISTDAIIRDVSYRLGLINRVLEGGELSDKEWGQLVYYADRNLESRRAFVDAMRGVASGQDPHHACQSLPSHGRWLLAVYTGQDLTASWCAGGSRFHRRVLAQMGSSTPPGFVLRQVKGLREAIRELQSASPDEHSKVIENLAIDETFEQLGRLMSG